jgi:NAD(P)-dependent dehydrogenase (short-subunit alcohol dehydrogenase family)
MTEARVVLVTGVSSGIGEATAALLSENGFVVFGTMRRPDESAGRLPGVKLVALDVCDEESVHACVQSVLARAGRIDALVNNAGLLLAGSLEETSLEESRQIFETNFFGVVRMCSAVLPLLRRQNGGRIVNISSVLGFLAAPYLGAYAASKHAIEGYTETLDHEVRQFGIRALLVEPGFTRTNLGRNSAVIRHPLTAYEGERNRALQSVNESIAKGDDPALVASTVLKALTSAKPSLRYPVGREARILSLLKKYAPSGLLDKGLRKQFGLRAV